MREVCADRTPLTPPSRNRSSSPRGSAEASEEPGRNEAATHLSQNVPVGLTDGTKSSVPAKAACSQFHRNGPGTHSGPHQPLTHLDRKQERGKEGGTMAWPLLLVWWVWPARDILDWAGSETQKLGFVVGRFEIRFARAHESQAAGRCK